MILKGACTKCKCEIQLDIGDINNEAKAKEFARTVLLKWKTFSCPGHHVEICSPYPYYWNVDEWEFVEGNAPAEEEFLNKLKAQYKEVLTTNEIYKRDVITGFAYGLPITNDGLNWNFAESPKGTRYYFHN